MNRSGMGKLISFEGVDGSGKSTQISLLEKRLKSEGYFCRVFREPGGTELSEKIREILLHYKGEIDPVAETLLFSSARAQIISEKVRPLLETDTIVVLDRYFDSTTAYQGFAREALSFDDLKIINRIATHGITPDLTIYLRLKFDEALPRISKNKDRMEKAGVEFYHKVIEGFDHLAENESRFRTISAKPPKNEVHEQIWTAFSDLMNQMDN